MSEFASAPYTAGQLNAMVKKLKELAGENGPNLLLSGQLTLKVVNLLKWVTTAAAPAVTKFFAKETFGAEEPVIKLWCLGDTFKQMMLGRVEEDVEAVTLTAHTLTRASLDAPILAELGDRAEVSLAHVWELLVKQANGKIVFLHTNGFWNIFYVRGIDGKPWAVGARWDAGFGWFVDAYSVEYPFEWSAGHQVVSR